MTFAQLRDQASKIEERIDIRLAEIQPESLPIRDLFDEFQNEGYDEKAIRTAVWDKISSSQIEIIGGSALVLSTRV